jgi:hypothetical protein
MRIKPVYILLGFILASSCLDPYYSGIKDYIDLPVIEGMIDNGPGPYTIRITHSTAINDMAILPFRHAVVSIEDDLGASETLKETAPGVYTTDPDGLRGQIGRSYRLNVKIEDRTYQSSFELIDTPLGIDSVFANIEKKSVTGGYVDGLQFYVNTAPITDQNTNLMWTFSETYKFRSEYKLDLIYYGVDSLVRNYSDTGRVCWKTDYSQETFTWSAQKFTGNKLNNFPLHFISTLSNKLSERYSLLLSQYTIPQPAYTYWSEIAKLQEEAGSMYTRQPYQVQGNITDAGNPDAVVLGYFVAAGMTTMRIFVDRPPLVFNYEECNPIVNLYQLNNPKQLKYPLFAMEVGGDQWFAGLQCFDCRVKGGKIEKPDFWTEQ